MFVLTSRLDLDEQVDRSPDRIQQAGEREIEEPQHEVSSHGTAVHIDNVIPTGREGTGEDPEQTLAQFDERAALEVQHTESDDVADSLADVAVGVGGSLLVGASRNRVYRRYVFGRVADHVVHQSTERQIPTIIYASQTGLSGRIQSTLFSAYRYLLKSRL